MVCNEYNIQDLGHPLNPNKARWSWEPNDGTGSDGTRCLVVPLEDFFIRSGEAQSQAKIIEDATSSVEKIVSSVLSIRIAVGLKVDDAITWHVFL